MEGEGVGSLRFQLYGFCFINIKFGFGSRFVVTDLEK